jgi:hypothetical protein
MLVYSVQLMRGWHYRIGSCLRGNLPHVQIVEPNTSCTFFRPRYALLQPIVPIRLPKAKLHASIMRSTGP